MKDLLDEFYSYKTEFIEKVKERMRDRIIQYFPKDVDIKTITIDGYTPYWCDGEPCEYGLNWWDIEINEKYDETNRQSVEDFKSQMSQIPDEFYKDIFGDHKKITFYRDGTIKCVECEEHD